MNVCIFTGRLANNPNMSQTKGENPISVIRFQMAISNTYKKDTKADFVSMVAYGSVADFIKNFFKKGMKIEIVSRVHTGNYEKDGQTIYFTEFIVEKADFGEKKNTGEDNILSEKAGLNSKNEDI